MMQARTYARRRRRLLDELQRPVVLMGHTQIPRNSPSHFLPFRQDSTFLYYTGCAAPDAVAVLLPDEGLELYLPEPHEDDELWHGPSESFEHLRERLGVERVLPRPKIQARLEGLGSSLLTMPVADPAANAELCGWLGQRLAYGAVDEGSPHAALLRRVAAHRLVKDEEELSEIRAALEVTRRAHLAARELARPGATEHEVASRIRSIFIEAGQGEAYSPIVTVRGEILHCPGHPNRLEAGQLLLIDAGSESPEGYAADVTRTFPVSGAWQPFQEQVHQIVLAAQRASIERCRPGAAWRDVHEAASLVLAEGLVELGLLRGGPRELVERGAHTAFFPHGLGHPLGLDVHDLRAFGTLGGWSPRSLPEDPPGSAYRRTNWTLEPGMVFTVEPGIYFMPALLRRAKTRERFAGLVDFERAERWIGFGGLRIEDDVLVTAGEPQVLSSALPVELVN